MIWLFQSLTLVFCLDPGRLGNLQVVTLTERSRNETCVIHLTCSVEDPNDNVSFSWQVSGSMLPSEANLTVSWDPKNFRDEIYMCIAENPVSNASSSVSVQSLCKGVINAKNVHLDTRWIIMVVPLICIVIFACLCVRRKKLADVFHFPAQQTQGAGGELPASELPIVKQMGRPKWKRTGAGQRVR
uniref:Ig-like domain-containing protein n=1 Tax=Sus scrofa TaxID=9823 RepID=A0A8D0P8B6_PIG